MTNQEAIEILHSDIDNKSCDGCQILCRDLKCPVNEALEMAIKALEQNPCDNAISRQDAIRICEERGHDNSAYCIRQLPPVNPQPKIGHWISYNWTESGLGITRWGIKCDQCNKQYKYGGEMGGTYSYCPNCGARMESEEI